MAERDRDDAEATKEEAMIAGQSSSELANCFLAALSPCPERLLAKGKDLAAMKRIVVSVMEAMEEGVLTESEANALLEFMAAKFVVRRFGALLHNVSDVGAPARLGPRAFREGSE